MGEATIITHDNNICIEILMFLTWNNSLNVKSKIHRHKLLNQAPLKLNTYTRESNQI